MKPGSSSSTPQNLETLTARDEQALKDLWQTLEGCSNSNSRDVLQRYFEQLKILLEAADCTWMAIRYGPSNEDVYCQEIFEGWWIFDVINVNPNIDYEAGAKAYFSMVDRHGTDPQSLNAVRHNGKSRVHIRRDVAYDEDWPDHWKVREFLLPYYGIMERMHAIFSLNPWCESLILIDRDLDAPPFSERERQLAYLATLGSSILHRRLFFERGFLEPSKKILSPRERQTLELLLTDRTEKEIAGELGVSHGTAHQYVTAIFRIFGVRSRAGLMQVWMKNVA